MNTKANTGNSDRTLRRYGIAEWYGRDFCELSPEELRTLAAAKAGTEKCPFRYPSAACSKRGGVCSLREYEQAAAAAVQASDDVIVTTCPFRFHDSLAAFSWVGRTILGTDEPVLLTELPFLKSTAPAGTGNPSTVGKIDMVLVHPDTSRLQWCALEIQAVYFSGAGMAKDFAAIKGWNQPGLPFPQGLRRPDFRSSGPKRLMPQLQIKVPTISRWGRKMAVLVDAPFWNAMGPMQEVDHISNCDIAWFVMKHEKTKNGYRMTPDTLHLTTLDRAVEGLTGGIPTSQTDFEQILLSKISNA